MNDLITLLGKLVAFESRESNPQALFDCLSFIEKQLHFFPFIIKRYESNGKPSLVATTTNTKHPTLFLVSHIDVVPAPKELFTLKQDGDKLIGRGVADMKFAVALFITILKEMYEEKGTLPNIGIMLTTEEEIEGNNGPGYIIEKEGYSADIAVLPDGGENFTLIDEAKGLLWVTLLAKGKAGHGSRPWEGINAIDTICEAGIIVRKLYPHPKTEEWVTTCNIGCIVGGEATNQIASIASMELDFRYTKDDSKEKIKAYLKEHLPDNVEIIELDHMGSFFVDIKNPHVERFASLLSKHTGNKEIFTKDYGATDAPFFCQAGIQTIISQPIMGGIHSDEEWMSKAALLEYKNLLKQFIQETF